MVAHHRLENALARAEELVTVGNQSAALQLLHDAIVSRWFAHNMAALEPIMLKFVELCVELRRGRLAKDGLHQYRSLAIGSNLAGLERVMLRLVALAETKLDRARQEALEMASAAGEFPSPVEDLDVAPEETLAQLWNVGGIAIGPSSEADRTGRSLITPWLRFLWEVFRVILELCRHNAKLEPLYRTVVERAFTFCRQWKRRAEFRRLCEILRHHLSIIVKYPNQINGIQLQSNPDSHALQLELRFKQLDVATEMELWHEAFRSIEDIHGLFVLARKSAMPSLVLTYYSRLAHVFRQSNRYLYLAATICKLFSLKQKTIIPSNQPTVEKEGLLQESIAKIEEELAKDATTAVLALLATPLTQDHDVTCTMSEEEVDAKESRLATFLGLTHVPTVTFIYRELKTRGLLARADATSRQLLSLLFEDPDEDDIELPIPKKEQLEPLLLELEKSKEFYPFIMSIYRNFVTKVLSTLSQPNEESAEGNSEKIISSAKVLEMISIPNVSSIQSFDLDRFLAEGVAGGDFYLRIEQGYLEHEGKIIFQKPCFSPSPTMEIPDYSHSREVRLAEMLTKLIPLGMPLEEVEALLDEAFRQVSIDQQAHLERKAKQDRRRELQEREDARDRALRQQAEHEAELRRLAEEAARREHLRREAEKETIRKEQASRREEEEQRRKEQLARRANLEKMIAVVKRRDYLERAYRYEEAPLRQEDYERQKEQDRAAYEERTRLIKERAQSQHTTEIQLKLRLNEIEDDRLAYLKERTERVIASHKVRQQEWQEKLVKAKRIHREKVLAEAQARAEQAQLEAEESENQSQEINPPERVEPEDAKKKYVPPHLKQGMSDAGSAPVFGKTSPFGASRQSSAAPAGSWRRAQS